MAETVETKLSETSSAERCEGQLNAREREILRSAIQSAACPPKVVVEVGTWLGGGSTIEILRALERNGQGHLWGIEADRSIYERMLANLKSHAPEAIKRFTPLFGFSQQVIPQWLSEQPPGFQIDLAFLDGGNRPLEQVTEFRLLEKHIPIGGRILAHDAKLRKGKWFVPFIKELDNWRAEVHDVSVEGLLVAEKLRAAPSNESIKRAGKRLLRLRLQPSEIAAVVLPASVCGFVLGLLPKRISARLSDGR